eukprot:1829517-Pleurochrysis_carterae.AAC.1
MSANGEMCLLLVASWCGQLCRAEESETRRDDHRSATRLACVRAGAYGRSVHGQPTQLLRKYRK